MTCKSEVGKQIHTAAMLITQPLCKRNIDTYDDGIEIPSAFKNL